MPANIESMFYVGDMPWHRKGVKLNSPPDSRSAIIYAGLDWTVEKVNLYSEDSVQIKDLYAIVRKDNRQALGVVGKGYIPLQNSEAFNFFDPFLHQGFIDYETAGSLGEGQTIWILAKLKSRPFFEVVKDDIVEKYLLLSNSHDGSSTVNIKFTPIRVVCQNTLTAALREGNAIKVRHTQGMERRLDAVRNTMMQINHTYDMLEKIYIKMANAKIDYPSLKTYFNELFPVLSAEKIHSEGQSIKNRINQSIHEQLYSNYEYGYGVIDLKIAGTLWAAYNAVTQYVDHPKDYKKGDDKLLTRIWFGDGEAIKKKALNTAIALMKAS